MPDDVVQLDYRLPVTVVQVCGTVTTTKDELAPPASQKTTERMGTATLEVRADHRTDCRLRLPARWFGEHAVGLNLTVDGRLTSAENKIDVDDSAGWRAALGTGVGLTASVLPLLAAAGPAGIAAAVGLGVAGGVATGAFVNQGDTRSLVKVPVGAKLNLLDWPGLQFVDGEESAGEPVDVPLPSLDELDIKEAYASARPRDCALLMLYRTAEREAVMAHAYAALQAARSPSGWATDSLAAQERALTSARRVSAPVEAAYAGWLAGHVKVTKELVDEEFFIDELPTEAQLREAMREEASGSFGGPQRGRWEQVAKRLRFAVTVDRHGDAGSAEEVSEDEKEVLYHRRPQLATVRCWRVLRPAQDDGDDFTVELIETQRVLVAHPDGTRSVGVQHNGKAEASWTFDDGGALVALSTSRSGAGVARASAAASLFETARDAAKAGKELGSHVTPAARAESLAGRVAELKAQSEIVDLAIPPPADPLKKLKADVAEAELKAKLAVARRRQRYPDTAVFALGYVDEPSDA